MAVLCEALSVIVKRQSINKFYKGGWQRFQHNIPNSTMCTDGELVRIGFFSPQEVKLYIDSLVLDGLLFLPPPKVFGIFKSSRSATDLTVVDQYAGPTMVCEWLQFAEIPFEKSGFMVTICWLFEGKKFADGLHMHAAMNLHTPSDWSPSSSNAIHYDDVSASHLVFLRTENGLDVYEDKNTGKVLYRPHVE